MKTNVKAPLLVVCALCLGVIVVLTGCFPATNGEPDPRAEKLSYMSQVNVIMDDLTSDLDEFSVAVASGDVVTMKTQAERAQRTIDRLEKVEAPEDLKDIHNEYIDGSKNLRESLSAYIDLFSDVDASTEAQPFDFSSYEERLDDIKEQYDKGIEHLENADKKATELNKDEEGSE